ncbi:cache domain-containing sensor histidine kinase [Bacillus sp. SD088]|uniref:cache domain-containing sensor histidine kinase n=1 Tax=Bacillus sp. SD088 TaxID=2782012 RepID=UPI001A96F5AD|nr:sensor histidine kinase [Bacillus sp. SD088]MBO0993125.1 sensor histidine kinase [Bacillus sp. SD088]
MMKIRLFKYNYKDLSIRSILLVSFICIAVIPIVLMSTVNYSKSAQIINNNAAQYVTQMLQQTNQELDLKLRQISDDSVAVLTNEEVQDSLNPKNSSIFSYQKRERLRDILTKFILSNGNVTGASIHLNDGNLLVTTGNYNNSFYLNKDLRNELDNYNGSVVWRYEQAHISNPQEKLIIAHRAIKNIKGPTVDTIGYLSFTISEDLVFDSIEEIRMGQTGSAFIIDKTGTVLTSQNRGRVGTKLDKELLKSLSGKYKENAETIIEQIGRKRYFIAFNKSEETEWRIIGLVPSEEMINGLWDVQKLIFIAVIIWIIIAIFLSLKITKTVTHPLNNLIGTMKKVEKGDFTVHVNLKQNRETNLLSNSFNSMIAKINELINQVFEKEMKEKQAELKALQAQINPHFLYNTLDTLYWMLYLKGEEKIGNLIVSLSRMLRYSIQNEGSFVSLKQELDNLKNYINLQSARYGTKLNFELEIDQSLENALVPKLILQPLVENAIHHGIEPCERDGKLTVQVCNKGDGLQIVVMDNGVGIEKAELERFKMERKINNGIGIHNVDERIKLTFGQSYGISIESEIGIGTKVTILLPFTERF